jgi:hypothetical protein
MNMPESNHIFADLGIPYMDTVTGSFAAQTPAKTQFSPIRSANFSLARVGRESKAGSTVKYGDDEMRDGLLEASRDEAVTSRSP